MGDALTFQVCGVVEIAKGAGFLQPTPQQQPVAVAEVGALTDLHQSRGRAGDDHRLAIEGFPSRGFIVDAVAGAVADAVSVEDELLGSPGELGAADYRPSERDLAAGRDCGLRGGT